MRNQNINAAPEGWVQFLRTLALNSSLKIVVSENVGAATDGKTIWLPAMPLELNADELTLFKGNAVHEVGHCMKSDIPYYQAFSAQYGQFGQFLLNCLDDVYMEGAMSKWSRMSERLLRESNLIILAKSQGRDGSASLAEAVGCYCLLYLTAKRWHGFDEATAAVEVNLREHLAEHADTVVPALTAMLDADFPAVKSTRDAGDLAVKIIELLKALASNPNKEPKPKEPSTPKGQSGQEQNSGSEGAPSSKSEGEKSSKEDKSSNGGSKPSNQGNDAGAKSNSEKPQGKPENGDGTNQEPGKSLTELIDEMLKDETSLDEVLDKGKAVKKQAKELKASGKAGPFAKGLVFVGGTGAGKEVGGFVDGMRVPNPNRVNAELIAECMSSKSNVLANRLRALLNNREEVDDLIGRRGRISEQHLYRFALDDARFFATSEEQVTETAAISLTADLSGSTLRDVSGSSIAHEIRCALTLLTNVLHQFGTPHEILGFAPKGGELNCLVKSFTDGNRLALDRIGALADFVGGGSTPTAEAVMVAGARLMSHTAQRKLMFVITDGVPSNVAAAVANTNAVLRQNVDVIYLVIGAAHSCQWLADAGLKYAQSTTAEGLIPALVSKVGDFLL